MALDALVGDRILDTFGLDYRLRRMAGEVLIDAIGQLGTNHNSPKVHSFFEDNGGYRHIPQGKTSPRISDSALSLYIHNVDSSGRVYWNGSRLGLGIEYAGRKVVIVESGNTVRYFDTSGNEIKIHASLVQKRLTERKTELSDKVSSFNEEEAAGAIRGDLIGRWAKGEDFGRLGLSAIVCGELLIKTDSQGRWAVSLARSEGKIFHNQYVSQDHPNSYFAARMFSEPGSSVACYVHSDTGQTFYRQIGNEFHGGEPAMPNAFHVIAIKDFPVDKLGKMRLEVGMDGYCLSKGEREAVTKRIRDENGFYGNIARHAILVESRYGERSFEFLLQDEKGNIYSAEIRPSNSVATITKISSRCEVPEPISKFLVAGLYNEVIWKITKSTSQIL